MEIEDSHHWNVRDVAIQNDYSASTQVRTLLPSEQIEEREGYRVITDLDSEGRRLGEESPMTMSRNKRMTRSTSLLQRKGVQTHWEHPCSVGIRKFVMDSLELVVRHQRKISVLRLGTLDHKYLKYSPPLL